MATQNVIQDGYYSITTGTFTIEKPLYSMRGKKIFCTGEPKFGAPIKQSSTLNVLCEYPLGSFLTHGVYGIGANPVRYLSSAVRNPWFCCFVMAQRVILEAGDK